MEAPPAWVEVKAKCSVLLKYRPVQGLSFNHAFWTIRGTSGLTHTTGADNVGGKLNNYFVLGTTGTLPEDNPSASTAWDSGLTHTVCAKADIMLNYAQNYVDNSINYSLACPNSNAYAHWVSNAASLSTSSPPNAPCW